MKTEKDNQTWYQNTFDEVHASEHLFRKVEAMRNENGIFKRTLSKGAIAAAAFTVLVFSNVISYAASGSPWILTVTLPGGETRQYEVGPAGEDGLLCTSDYEAADQSVLSTSDYEAADQSVLSETAGSAEADVTVEVSGRDDAYRLEECGGRICLVLDEQHRVDITEDFQDGSCTGTFDADGMTWCYEVTGTLEQPMILVYVVTCSTIIP